MSEIQLSFLNHILLLLIFTIIQMANEQLKVFK